MCVCVCVCMCVCARARARVCACVCVRVKVSVGSICKLTGYAQEKLTRHCYLDQSTHSVNRSTPCMELVK